jgi:hypothetical protein
LAEVFLAGDAATKTVCLVLDIHLGGNVAAGPANRPRVRIAARLIVSNSPAAALIASRAIVFAPCERTGRFRASSRILTLSCSIFRSRCWAYDCKCNGWRRSGMVRHSVGVVTSPPGSASCQNKSRLVIAQFSAASVGAAIDTYAPCSFKARHGSFPSSRAVGTPTLASCCITLRGDRRLCDWSRHASLSWMPSACQHKWSPAAPDCRLPPSSYSNADSSSQCIIG